MRKDITRLESIQRLATLYMLNYTDCTYIERLNQTNLLPLSYLREIYDLVLFYNMLHDRLNIDKNRYFNFSNELRLGRSAGKDSGIIIPFYKTEHGKAFYTCRVVHLWNKLPSNIRDTLPPEIRTSKPTIFMRLLFNYYRDKLQETFNVERVCTWVSACSCPECR